MNKSQKKILVTGGSGFIGAAIIKKLVLEGHKIKCYDNNSRGSLRRLDSCIQNKEFIEGDIRDLDRLTKYSKKIDCMIHLAFINGTEFFYKFPDLILDVGVKGIMNVIEACKKNEVSELILASSSEVYQYPNVIPTPENISLIVPDVLNNRYSYGAGKIISEVVAIHNKKFFNSVKIFRPHNVYGPDMGWEHVIPQFILKFLELIKKKKKNFVVLGDGSQTRSFNFIDDFVEGFFHIFESSAKLDIFNIGTSEEINILNLAKKISKIFKYEVDFFYSEKPKGETNRRCPDISKIYSLGYKPSFNIDQGLEITCDWYKNNLHLKK